jgi:type VI protein secretion system component VasK
VANPTDPSTQVLHVDPPTAAVFVDRSGRRSRRLRRAAYWLVALALVLLALVWLALGLDIFGLPAAN